MPTPNTTCATIRPLLSSFVDGETDPEEATLVREHLAACGSCASHLAFLRALGSALNDAPLERPSPLLYERIAKATYARPTLPERITGWFAPVPVRLAVSTGVAAGIVAALVLPRLSEMPAATVGDAGNQPASPATRPVDSTVRADKVAGGQSRIKINPVPAMPTDARVVGAAAKPIVTPSAPQISRSTAAASAHRVAATVPAPKRPPSAPAAAALSSVRPDAKMVTASATSAEPSAGSIPIKTPTRHIALNAAGRTRVSRLVSPARPTLTAPLSMATPATGRIAVTGVTPERAPATPAPTPEVPRPSVPIAIPEAATRVAAAAPEGNNENEPLTHAVEPIRARSGFRATLAGLGVGRRTGGQLDDIVDNSKAKLAVQTFGPIVGQRGTSGFSQ